MENAVAYKKQNSKVESTVQRKKRASNTIIFIILCALVVVFLYPIIFIVINSFKGKFFISENPFALPTAQTFSGLTNYINGLERTGFFSAMGWSFFITILSVAVIIFFTSMTAYYITRVKSKGTNVLYYLFVFSMIVPFQMVMFPMVKLADVLEVQTSQLLEVKVDSDVQTTEEKQNAYAEQLAHIAEQMAIRNRQRKRIWKTIGIAFAVIIVVCIILIVMNIAFFSAYPTTEDVQTHEETIMLEE